MNDDTFSPSELIYLYLDGEADTAQHAMLFAALAHDPELQVEFQDALQMRLSLATEVRQTLPPPALKEALLQKAAVGVQIASEAGAGVVASQAVSQTAGNIFAVVKSALVPLFSAVAGTLIVATSVFTPKYSPVERPAAPTASANLESSALSPVVPEPIAPAEQSGVSESEKFVSSSHSSVPLLPASVVVPHTAHAAENVLPNNTVTELPPDDAPLLQEESVSISSVAPLESGSQLATENNSYARYIRSSVQEPFWFAENGEMFSWSVYGRGIIGMQLFPWRSLESTGEFASNIAVGILYDLDEKFAAGIELGRENLPLYASSNGAVLEQRSTVQWAGLTGRYILKSIALPGNIQPFVTGLLGATEFGPITKSVLGIHWQPDTHIGLSLGVEGTTLFYRYQQQWYSTQKLGVSYGVEVRF